MAVEYGKVRFYTKKVKVWTHIEESNSYERTVIDQIEWAYKDYYLDGTLAGTGTEDFSYQRYASEMIDVYVHTWDGKKRNKGGKRWFDERTWCKIRKSDRKMVKKYFENYYPGYLVQLR